MLPHVVTKVLFLKRFLCLPRCRPDELFSVLILVRNKHYPEHFNSHVLRFIFCMEILSQHSRESKGCRVKTRIRLKDHSHKHSSAPVPPLLCLRTTTGPRRDGPLSHCLSAYSPFKSEAASRRAKANILQGSCVLGADDAAILLAERVHVQRVWGREKRERNGTERWQSLTTSRFRLTRSGTGWIKHHLCSVRFLYRPPPPPSLPQGGPALHAVFHWLL